MYRTTYQSGFFSIFYSIGSNPLSIWRCEVNDGYSKRITDEDLNSVVLELISRNATITFITAPATPNHSLGIKLPFLTLILKNMHKYFCFEIQIRDDENQLRRYQASNFQSRTRISTFCVQMPLCLANGWNQIQVNLADFTRRAFGTNYLETVRVRINANVRLRRVYFTDRLYAEHEKPTEYRLLIAKKQLSEAIADSTVPPTTPECVTSRPLCCQLADCQAACANEVKSQ